MRRCLDFLLATLLLLLSLPAQLVTAVLVAACLGTPVLFRQTRIGRHSRPFTVYKFRTMTDARDAEGNLLPDADRLPAVGRWLRTSALDELPQLWNIVKGDMSFIGPRPLPAKYLPLYSPRQARRHEIRPGLTGLAQCKGRNDIDWESRLEYDVQYVDTCSLALDLSILLQTAALLLRRRGTNAQNHATMPEFRGSAPAEPTASSR